MHVGFRHIRLWGEKQFSFQGREIPRMEEILQPRPSILPPLSAGNATERKFPESNR